MWWEARNIKNMRKAFNELTALPVIKKHVEGNKFGRVQFTFEGRVVVIVWLNSEGRAWLENNHDFDPRLLKRIVKDIGEGDDVRVVRCECLIRAATIMKTVEDLFVRGHAFAKEVMKRKADKVCRLAKRMGFGTETINNYLMYGWRVHYNLTSRKVLVYTSMFGYVRISVAPNFTIPISTSLNGKLGLVDVYECLKFRGVEDAFDLVADTPEKRLGLLTYMLAKGGEG